MAARRTTVPKPEVEPAEASVVDALGAVMTAPRLIQVDPRGLELTGNIRADAGTLAELTQSIKTRGVLVPILIEEVDGGYRVIDGQRRTLSAVKASVMTIPAIVQPILPDDERVIEQLVVNDQREQLTEKDRANGWKKLSLDIGLTPDQIARKTGVKPERVKSALAAVDHPQAAALLEAGEVELASRIAALGTLTAKERKALADRSSDPRDRAWAVARIENERAAEAKREGWRAQARELGLQFIEEDVRTNGQYGGDDTKHQPVGNLVDKVTGASIELADHEGCPGRALSIARGELTEVCSNPPKFGHVLARKYRAPKTAEEIETAKAEKQRKEDALIAATNRRAWVKSMLTRGLPDGWLDLVVDVTFGFYRTGYAPWELAAELLDVDPGDYAERALRTWLEQPARVNAQRPQKALLASAIARIETGFENGALDKGYLELLAKWGYEPTEFEQRWAAE
jgi:ParB family chromosome partitioning protein